MLPGTPRLFGHISLLLIAVLVGPAASADDLKPAAAPAANPPPQPPSPSGIVAVLPLDVTLAELDKASRVTLEEDIRSIAGVRFSELGYTVLTGENTLRILSDNGVDPAKACDATCALDAARELKAVYFLSGTVAKSEGVYVAFVRLFEPKKGQQLAAVKLEGEKVRELRAQLETKADDLFSHVPRLGVGPPEQSPPPAAAAATAPPVTAAANAPPPVAPALPPPAPTNPKLESARTLLAKRRFDDALKVLNAAAELPGNTSAMATEISVSRVVALLHKRRPDRNAARGIVLDLLHADPDATTIKDAADEVQELVREVRDSQPLLVYDPVTVAKPDRPIRFRVRVRDNAPDRPLKLTLHYKPREATVFSSLELRRDSNGFITYIRNPQVLAPAGVSDDFFVDYYVTAADTSGRVLDTSPAIDRPLAVHVSAEEAAAAEVKAGININLVEHPPPPPPLPPPPPPPTPWYAHWYTIGGAGVIVVGGLVGIIYAAATRAPLPSHVGVLNLP